MKINSCIKVRYIYAFIAFSTIQNFYGAYRTDCDAPRVGATTTLMRTLSHRFRFKPWKCRWDVSKCWTKRITLNLFVFDIDPNMWRTCLMIPSQRVTNCFFLLHVFSPYSVLFCRFGYIWVSGDLTFRPEQINEPIRQLLGRDSYKTCANNQDLST